MSRLDMANEDRAHGGRRAMTAGTDSCGLEAGIDTIVNVLHALARDNYIQPEGAGHVTGIALAHFADEIADEQEAGRGS